MTTFSKQPLFIELVKAIGTVSPMQMRALDAAVLELDADERNELEDYVQFCVREGWGIGQLVEAYKTITDDTLREQVYFQRHGRYRHSSFESVANSVYFDESYMFRYMYGLALTLYLWPNHLQLVRFFKKMLPRGGGNRYLEVGPGHGAFFRHAVRRGGYKHYVGVDISPTSLEMTRRILGMDDSVGRENWDLIEADFLTATELDGGYDAIVMGEVLEHVEQPRLFLERIRELAAKNAFIYITTAVNAPAIDHIYLFNTVDEVVDIARAAGLRMQQILATPYIGCTMDATVQRKLPINVAMVLSR